MFVCLFVCLLASFCWYIFVFARWLFLLVHYFCFCSFIFVCLSVCLFICFLFVCLSVYSFVCLFLLVHYFCLLFIHLFPVRSFVCLLVFARSLVLFIRLFICSFGCLFFFFVCLYDRSLLGWIIVNINYVFLLLWNALDLLNYLPKLDLLLEYFSAADSFTSNYHNHFVVILFF